MNINTLCQWLESDYGLSSSAGGWRGCGLKAPTAGPPTPPLSQPQLLSRAHQGLVLGIFLGYSWGYSWGYFTVKWQIKSPPLSQPRFSFGGPFYIGDVNKLCEFHAVVTFLDDKNHSPLSLSLPS